MEKAKEIENEAILKKYEQVLKSEAQIKKIVMPEAISKMIEVYGKGHKKMTYPKTIDNPKEIALNFYKELFPEYYKIILKGIEEGRVIFDSGENYVDPIDGICHIHLFNNDGDVYLIVHELAHYIDANSTPSITEKGWYIFAEVFSFYMEKRLEIYLGDNLTLATKVRKNNRLYQEENMLEIIEAELAYEEAFLNGTLRLSSSDVKIAKRIMKNAPDVVNYLLRYPLANILSEFLVDNPDIKIDANLSSILRTTNLYELLDLYRNRFKINSCETWHI